MAAPLLLTPVGIELAPIPGGFARLADLERLLDAAEPRVRRAFLVAIGQARGLRSLEEIARLIDQGRIFEATAAIEQTIPPFITALEAAFRTAGVAVAVGASRSVGRSVLEFNDLNERAVYSLRQTRAKLIRELGREQRAATLELLSGFQDLGTDPRVQARVLRASLGLTQRQAAAVANYRRLLLQGSAEALDRQLRDRRFDPSVLRAVRGGRPLAREQVDRMVERYRERYIAYRARTVARTETVRAVHMGQEEMLAQLVEDGLVRPEAIVRRWITRSDERVRHSHSAMHEQKRFQGEAFLSGLGNVLRFPGDPDAPPEDTVNCRCILAISLPRLKGSAGPLS